MDLYPNGGLATVVAVTAAPTTRDDELVADWLSTQALQLSQAKGLQRPSSRSAPPAAFPRRSDLRRAEQRIASTKRGPGPGHKASLRSGLPQPIQMPIAMAPTAAVLPLPHTSDATRPAGVTLPSRRLSRQDAFTPPAQPTVPIAVPQRLAPAAPVAPSDLAAPGATAAGIDPADWGLNPLDVQLRSGRRRGPDDARPATRKPSVSTKVRGKARAARILVLALVVGAEGVAVTSLAGVSHARPATTAAGATGMLALSQALPASAVLDDAAARQDFAVSAQAQAFADATAQTESADFKATAALQQARAAADRVRREQEAREQALRNARRDPKSLAKLLLADRGWSGQFGCLDSLWTRESRWNYQASNSSSGAYGIPQALPGSKMASVGADWRTNPVTQMKWGLNYIADRYGTPCSAWGHSQDTGWY